jgi:hypothetical protein
MLPAGYQQETIGDIQKLSFFFAGDGCESALVRLENGETPFSSHSIHSRRLLLPQAKLAGFAVDLANSAGTAGGAASPTFLLGTRASGGNPIHRFAFLSIYMSDGGNPQFTLFKIVILVS